MTGTDRSVAIGLASALGVFCIWSGFIVFSRAGVMTALTPYDIAGLRFLVAGLVVAPFARAWWPRGLGWPALLALTLAGPGAIYSLLMYVGLGFAPAAWAGVFANGSLPLFTMLIAFVMAGDRPGPRRMAAVALIVTGGVLVAWRGLAAPGEGLILGVGLFLAASAVLSVYIRALARWSVAPTAALAAVNLPSMAFYLPVWFLFLPSGLGAAGWNEIAFQGLFQGLGPGFLALILFTLSARNLGAVATAGFSAAVPAGAAVLAAPVLGEVLSAVEWAGVGSVTLGLFVLVARR